MSASVDIKRVGAKEGHTHDTLTRSRRRLGYPVESEGFLRRTYWKSPEAAQQPQAEQVHRTGGRWLALLAAGHTLRINTGREADALLDKAQTATAAA